MLAPACPLLTEYGVEADAPPKGQTRTGRPQAKAKPNWANGIQGSRAQMRVSTKQAAWADLPP